MVGGIEECGGRGKHVWSEGWSMVGGVRCVERSEVSGKSGGVREKWSVVGGVEECGGRGGGAWEG